MPNFRPTTEKLAQFISARPPMTTLMACFFIIGLILLVFSNYINYNVGSIENPDIDLNWNTLFFKLNEKKYCIDENEPDFSSELEQTKLFDEQFFTRISISSLSIYTPLKNYISGSYHENQENFPLKYKFQVNATDLGILKKDKPKHATEIEEELYKNQLLTINLQLANYYEHNQKCGFSMTSEENKYSHEQQADMQIDCAPSEVSACLEFVIPTILFNNTKLNEAKLPTNAAEAFDLKSNVPDAFKTHVCRSDQGVKVGTAKPLSGKIKNEFCPSYLSVHTGHKKDPTLVDYLSQEDIDRIKGRLFWSSFFLLALFGLYLLYGSIRGSGTYTYDAF